MKYLLIVLWLILPVLGFNQNTLTPAEIKFAASYIKYLEKKDSINNEIIKEYERKTELEESARLEYGQIVKWQDDQLELYKEVNKNLIKINDNNKKANAIKIALSFLLGYLVGNK